MVGGMTNRQAYDPYAPPPSVRPPAAALDAAPELTVSTESGQATENAREAAEQIPDDLNTISKDDLIALAELADVAAYGTKAEIAARVRAAAGL